MKNIGIMGYQGGGDQHLFALSIFGIIAKKISSAEELENIDALILPGGESSAQYNYCMNYDMKEAIVNFVKSGKIIFATCAGLILLSNYQSEKVNGFGLLNVDISRNIYGSQIISGIKISDKGNKVLFIRAPGIIKLGDNVEILDTYLGQPILVKQDNIIASCFHPEFIDLNESNILYQIFK